jgi:hypothetical protein
LADTALGDFSGFIMTDTLPPGPLLHEQATLQQQGGPMQAGAARRQDGGTWTAFLIMAFAVLGLVGAFSVFAAQIPFERALARSAALDRALTVSGEPDAAAKLDAMRPELGDSADHILPVKSDMGRAIAAERSRMFEAFGRESEDIGTRLRIVIAVFTGACAVFGTAVLSIVRRAC